MHLKYLEHIFCNGRQFLQLESFYCAAYKVYTKLEENLLLDDSDFRYCELR